MTISNDELSALVDWEAGLVSARIFVDQDIYDLEMERVFGRSWLFLAHDSMIPDAGDFISTYMGADPVIVVRQHDGGVKAFLNVCRHRGMKVCRADEGNAKVFMCTYHGWTYDRSGSLVNVPNFDHAYYGELDTSRWGLVEVAQVDSYKGLIFATFDPTAPSLVEYLGDMTFYLDAWLGFSPGGIEVLPGAVKWRVHGNWKLAAEQFAGDAYHAATTHLSSLGQLIPNFPDNMRQDGRQLGSRLGHGTAFRANVVERESTMRFADDSLAGYQYETALAAQDHLGAEQAAARGVFTVFPNFSGLPAGANMRVWHPKGPNQLEICSWVVVDKDAPPEIKKAQQRASVHTEGAAGMVEQDDGENWDQIGAVLAESPQARKLNWNYQMGLGREGPDTAYPGNVGPRFLGEVPQRAFYRRWLELMVSNEWPRIEPDDAGTPRPMVAQ